ncbi:hypothetical protein V496_05074 [Pseudogymnoascus sp. VKM F-4515 (FW-2607)]|nr:hypothetical protein V496_05074 [Pseudogymnoascus sp. VKM F-4515 (FW-2607)]
MADEYAEAEFERVPSEEQSEDVEMPDIAPPLVGVDRPYGDDVMAQDCQLEPHQSIEKGFKETWPSKFIIAVDFGTTFSSVAFVRLDLHRDIKTIGAESVRCIDNFPDMPSGISADVLTSHQSVPTELMCYAQKDQVWPEDPSNLDSSDNESQCSYDDDWASSVDGDSNQDGERDVVSARAAKYEAKNSIWGWGVHSRLVKPENIPLELRHLTNFKLQLDDATSTKDLRKKSAQELRRLKNAKAEDIIAEYLGQLFKHTKKRLATFHGLQQDSQVEFVLCVPTSWTDKACRIMQSALTTAIKTSQLAKLEQGMIRDLFIVAESEAAATFALEDCESLSNIITNESFLLLDCGGGTVDAITYTLIRSTPTRMQEVVNPKGVSCGSSFLNKNYKKLLEERLEHANIIGNDMSLERIIAAEVQRFENEKRSINILDKKAHIDAIHIPGLQAEQDRELRIRRNKLDLSWKEMYKVFKDCLDGTKDLMLEQLNQAKTKGVNVQTVILTGGFGESPSLRNHLKKILRKQRNLLNQEIDFEPSRYVQSAVARGAVLRALRKEFGPARITRSSYGVLRTLLYDENNPQHRKVWVSRDRADGELYIMNTIQWVLSKDTPVGTKYEKSFKSRHIFQMHEDFLCEEILYVSSGAHKSGYKYGHKENKGAEEAGRILVNLTFLKTTGRIKPTTVRNAEGKLHSFYEVQYDLWLIIEGRSLRFEARSPINKDEVKASASFCIAAGFVPGTE